MYNGKNSILLPNKIQLFIIHGRGIYLNIYLRVLKKCPLQAFIAVSTFL